MSISNQFTKISELDKRFNIGKNTRVNRLAMLGLTPDRLIKQGRCYLLTEEQLRLFAEFDAYIIETGNPNGYPRLLSAHSDRPITLDPPTEEHVESQVIETDKAVQVQNQVDSDSGQITIARQDLENLLNLGPEQPDISSFTGEFTGTLYTHQDNGLTHRVKANAQSRAMAILIAEHTLAEEYINNPDLIDPALRAQLDDIQPVRICPKELAASLISAATVQHLMKAA